MVGSMVELAPVWAEMEVAKSATATAATAELENIILRLGIGWMEWIDRVMRDSIDVFSTRSERYRV